MRIFSKPIPTAGLLLAALVSAGIPPSVSAVLHNDSDTPATLTVEPEDEISAAAPSKVSDAGVLYKGLIDLNRDGILDKIYREKVFISNGGGFVEKKIEGCTLTYLWNYAYMLNDDIVVAVSEEKALMTFSKSDLKFITSIKLEPVPADVDNDGQMEYLATADGRVIYHKIEPDGQIKSYPLRLYVSDTQKDENEEEEDAGRSFVAWDYSMLGASMAQMFGRDGSGGSKLAAGDVFQVMDFNGDGLTDFIASHPNQGASVYINIGDGSYYAQSFSGKTFFADFNGDGICDYVVADGTALICCLTDPEGGAPAEKTILSGFTLKNIWCRDVDRDGDSDLILIVTGSAQCFGVIMENDGKGSFRRREYSLPHTGTYDYLFDWDNDGNYEILSATQDEKRNYVMCSNKITGTVINTSPDTIPSDGRSVSYYPEPSVGKIKIYERSFVTQTLSDNPNTRPTPPAQAPSVVYEPKTGLVRISWTAGSDVETPAADLTYSVRIGTSSGADDVVSAQAGADGMRLWPCEGNVGRMLYRVYDTSSWPQGKLYIAVQAVDGNMQGSAFSTEAVFEKTVPACEFHMDYCDYFAVNDTLTLSISRMDGTPQWKLDGGRIVSSDGNIYKVVFSTSGRKAVTLTVADGAGNLSAPKTKSLQVLEAPVHEGLIRGERQGEIVEVNAWTTFDMDEDGIDEIYHSLFYFNEGGFLKGDDKGVYRKIDKMFNSHQFAGKFYGDDGVGTFDINRDGMCDIAYREYLGYNLGDLDMDFENTGAGKTGWIDFDNDGLYDAVMQGAAYRNDGDYKSFNSKYVYFGAASVFGDFNHDGLMDIADIGQRQNQINILYNNGDFTFTEGEVIMLPDYIDYDGLKVVEDIDGDGKLDVIFQNLYRYNGKYNWTILFGNGQVKSEPGYYGSYFDFNNDGKKEIMAKGESDGYHILYFSNGSLRRDPVSFRNGRFGDNTYVLSDGARHLTNWSTYPGGAKCADSACLSVDNERPLPPANLRHTQNDKFVVISWDHSADKETPSASMRYNISVKHKEAEGEGAYLLSPANSGKNGVRVPLHKPLLHTNCISIPVANIPAGDYEVMVQGVDLMHDQSDFSETYLMHVSESSHISAPTSGEVNVPVSIRVLANTGVSIDWGGGEVVRSSSGLYEVAWTIPGLKTVTIDGQQSKLKIDAAPDPSFVLPEGIRYGDVVTFGGSSVNDGAWYWVRSKYSGEYSPDAGWIYNDEGTDIAAPNEFADFEVIDAETANITIRKYNDALIRHKVSSRFSTQTCDRSLTIPYDNNISGVSDRMDTPSNPSIGFVTADAATGKYRLQWTNPEETRPEATGLLLYRETAVAGKYELLAELPLSATEYVDLGSNPDIVASRYALAYKLTFGRSCYSRVHQPVHVMINRGAGSSWNLIWGRYEGATIPQYRILRGTSPENLQVIAEVSGNMDSYTDFTAPAGTALYYAVESVLQPAAGAGAPSSATTARASSAPRSNVVAAAGSNITLATSIRVLSADGNTTIDGSEASAAKSVQLMAVINPSDVAFRRPSWIVISGDDLVNVDNLGNVTPTGRGSGTATVRAMTIDGSGLYADIDITVTGYSGAGAIADDLAAPDKLVVYPVPADYEVNVVTSGEDTDIYIFSVGGGIVARLRSDAAVTTVDCSGWVPGVYIVRAVNRDTGRSRTARLIKR